jgi:UDP-glucose 4-epimerase
MCDTQYVNWLITGGAGYIGSHVVYETLRSGRNAVVLYDLSTGIKSRRPSDVAFEEITLTDRESVFEVFERHSISGVLHLAAKNR